MMSNPIVTVHMVSSLDGFIAKKDNSISWMETTDTYENGVDGEDPEAFLKTIDCFVMGSKTYEHVVELSQDHGWPYGDVPTYVLTSKKFEPVRDTVKFYASDVESFVKSRSEYANIWVVGGAALVKDFLNRGLVHEIRQSILPIIIGGGTPFYDCIGQEHLLHLKDVTAYKNGIVELWFEVLST